MNIKKLLIFIIALTIVSCSVSRLIIKGKGDIKLRQVDFSQLKGWETDNHSRALQSFINSCNKFASLGDDRQIGGQIGDITIGDFRDVCEIGNIIKGMSSKQVKNFFENWFVPFEVSTKEGNYEGKFTGYYEAELKGSKVKTDVYQYPVYARPENLTKQLYYSRKEINNGALDGKSLELLYVDDKVDLFFMHIQGTGRIILPDGVVMKLSYDGKNNQPYTSIGKYILENNLIDGDKSYHGIKSWLKSNSKMADKVMNINSSYIFFKVADKEYVIGAQGVPLTPERSLAIDKDIMSYGYPIWVETRIKLQNRRSKPYRKLLVTQDTGSAIKGVIRGDVFLGRGKRGESLAAGMNHSGRYYILLPVAVVDKFSKR